MYKYLLPALLCAGILVVIASCSDEEQEYCCLVDPPLTGSATLTEKWHVLDYLEATYNQRNSPEYSRLIDPDDFVFWFSPTDFANGSTPEQWGPAEDVVATQVLLQDAISIDLDVVFLPDSLQWLAIQPTNFPDETWFQTTVSYSFTMRFNSDPNTTFLTSGSPLVSFTVREYDDNGTMRWRLVEWRDLTTSLTIVPSSSGVVEETSWGRVKALYN